jgi:hypothetical protein
MSPLKKYELTLRTGVLRGEKPGKGLEAKPAPNPNQSNRLIGYLPDGTKIVVAQVPGKGGMDFNKLQGGKVDAVACDGFFPMFEKDENKKRTKIQKMEDGLPVYTSSGFYLLSDKQYPALEIREVFTMLRDKGEQVWIISEEQLAAKERHSLSSDFDLEMLLPSLQTALGDERNRLLAFDAAINKRRKRGIERGKEEAEDAGENYTGVEFTELKTSKKDGNPFVLYAWHDGTAGNRGAITRERDVNEDGKIIRHYLTAEEALSNFKSSAEYQKLEKALGEGRQVEFAFAQGDVMRTSVSFRRKVENVLAAPPEKSRYGDGVYILGAMKGWTRGIINVMYSQHPGFPGKDYDAHHYVAACRQAEVGMNKTSDGKWTPPEAVHYALAPTLLG